MADTTPNEHIIYLNPPKSCLSLSIPLAALTLSIRVLNRLHKLVQLPNLLVYPQSVSRPPQRDTKLTAHLIQLRLVQFLADPSIPFQLLRVQLPFRKEPNLASLAIIPHCMLAPLDVRYEAGSRHCDAPGIHSSRSRRRGRASRDRASCGGRGGCGGRAGAAGGERGPR